jgi:hypothetical protein
VQPGKIAVRRGHGGESHCRVELGTGVISRGVCRTRDRTMTRQTVQGGEGRCALLKTTASAGVACQLQLRKSTSLTTKPITMKRFACSLFRRLCASYRTKCLHSRTEGQFSSPRVMLQDWWLWTEEKTVGLELESQLSTCHGKGRVSMARCHGVSLICGIITLAAVLCDEYCSSCRLSMHTPGSQYRIENG